MKFVAKAQESRERDANMMMRGFVKIQTAKVLCLRLQCLERIRADVLKFTTGTGGQIMSRIIQYTADDEEPECRNCDNQDGQKICENCGPEYGWAGYIRSDLEVDENE